LRPENCQLAEYEAWFESECNKLTLDPGFSVVGPFIAPRGIPGFPPWHSDFAIIYPDHMYIRVAEYYEESSQLYRICGYRRYFAYHYGKCSDQRDEDGFPCRIKAVNLRIEQDNKNGCHAHHLNPNHIPQSRLPGLDFDRIDPFEFIRAVDEHRRPLRPLHEILGFNWS